MAERPTTYPEWATSTILERRDINGDGVEEVLENKLEPIPEWKNSGQLYQQPLPYPYINYQFDLIDGWAKHLDQRYAIGDIHLTTTSESVSEISTRLGGTWELAGTETLAGRTIRFFAKTA